MNMLFQNVLWKFNIQLSKKNVLSWLCEKTEIFHLNFLQTLQELLLTVL